MVLMVNVVSSTTSQAGHLLGRRAAALAGVLLVGAGALQVGVALDGLEEVGALVAVRAVGGVVPGFDEALGRDRRAVVELVVRLDLDGEVLVVGGLDRLSDVHLGSRVLGVVVDQLRRGHVEDVATTGLGGVAGDQRVLGVAPVDDDLGGGSSARVVVVVVATAGREHTRGEDYGGDNGHGAWNASHESFSFIGTHLLVRTRPGPGRSGRRYVTDPMQMITHA